MAHRVAVALAFQNPPVDKPEDTAQKSMMDRTFEATFKHFTKLVVDMHVQWQMFRDLYEKTDDSLVYNSTAPNFFIHLRSYLYDLIFLSISRFFDPAKQQQNENLSLKRMISFEEVSGIRAKLGEEQARLEELWKSGIAIWRNKAVSHNDLPTVFDPRLLPNIPNKDIELLIEGISNFARQIEHHVYHRDQSYDVGIQGWVPQLISYLKRGIEKREEEKRKRSNP